MEDLPAPEGLDNFRSKEGGACLGWQIVCPDGKTIRSPYHNKGDAEFDCNYVNTEYINQICDWNEKYWQQSSTCPGGVHTIWPVAFGDCKS